MKELWKEVKGFEGLYEVSNKGFVRSIRRKVNFGTQARFVDAKILKPFKKKEGYLSVKLYKECKQYTYYIHRLVAFAFCDGYVDGMDVNHKDGDKTNNVSCNLEWCTRKENINHAVHITHRIKGNTSFGRPYQKPIIQLSLNGDVINKWDSAFHAQRVLGFCESGIRKCLHGKSSKYKGFKWTYASEEVV